MPTLYKILSYREKVIFFGSLAFALIFFANFIRIGTLDFLFGAAIGIAIFFMLIFYFERKYRHRRKERPPTWKPDTNSQFMGRKRRSSWKSNNSSQYNRTLKKLQNQQNKKEAELKAQYNHTLKKLQNQQNKKESEQKDEIKQMKSKFTELEKKLSSVTPKENEVKDIKENTFHNFPSRQDLNDNFSGIDPFQMEEIVGALFEKKGYSVEVTKRTNDFGIDVWATNENEKIGIQVKKWKDNVGFKDVSGTLGSSIGGGANRCIIISATSFFHKPALKWEKERPWMIELWDTNRFKKELQDNDVMTS